MGYQLNYLAKCDVINGYMAYIISSNSFSPWMANGFIEKNYLYGDDDYNFTEKTGVKIFRIKSLKRISGREILNVTNVNRIIREINPNGIIIHGTETITAIYFIINYKKYGIPIVFDSHMIDKASINKFSNLFYRLYSKLIVPHIKKNKIKIIAVSEATQEFLINKVKVPKEQVYVISLGTDTEMFAKNEHKRIKGRKEYNILENEFVYIYTGKISSNKKVLYLIEAFNKVHAQLNNTKLLVVGSGKGEYYNEVLRKASANVIFLQTKSIEELSVLYNVADCAVWPGASSLSFYDAQATKLPVILENIDINIERTKYNNGICYLQESINDLSEKMILIVQMKEDERVKMGEKGRNEVEAKYSYKVISKKFEGHLFGKNII